MKDILIVYDSKTGNTEKVAKAMAEVAGERCVLSKVQDAPSSEEFPLIAAGYWVDKGEPNDSMKKYLSTLKNKKLLLFQTLGAEATGAHALSTLANTGILLDHSCKVMSALSIRGAIDPNLITMMRKMPPGTPHAPTVESEARWLAASSHPDADDLAQARKFMADFLVMYDNFLKNN